jgi:AcrR family transcriptional regulator
MTDSGPKKSTGDPIGRQAAKVGADAVAGQPIAGNRLLPRHASRRSSSGRAGANAQGRRSTKAKLMDVAEILIARHGVDGVSLRDIGLLAGQANSNVIQYHFDNKLGLVFAILEDRNSKRESMRREMFDELKKNGDLLNPRKLLEILWAPSLNFLCPDGNHIYCHFLMQCRLHPEFSRRQKHDERDNNPIFVEIIGQLRAIYGTISEEVFRLRLAALTMMVISSVVENDKIREINPNFREFELGPYLDIATAALAAPAST